jgi:hypothetical protein
MFLEANDSEYLVRHLVSNNVVLFLGAGFSVAAQNTLGENLPSSFELARDLWAYLGYEEDYDGTALGILYQAALTHPKGTPSLFSFLRSRLWVSSFPDWYKAITEWFWYRIYSTNVDNLVEYVYKRHAKRLNLDPVVAPSEFNDRDAFLRQIQLVKLHGSLDKPERGLTFAPREYGRRASELDVWYDHFVRDFCTMPTLLVGTELNEPLFWQYIAIRQRRPRGINERRPKSFLICPTISRAKRDALSEFNVVPIESDSKQFFQFLSGITCAAPAREEVLRRLDPSLDELFEVEKSGKATAEVREAEKFFSIFRRVRYLEKAASARSHFLLGSPPTWDDMYAHLDAEREINSHLRSAVAEELQPEVVRTPTIILTGAAGAGKTTIAKRVALSLASQGLDVYFAEEEVRPLAKSIINYLSALERRVVLVFDNAPDDLGLIREVVIDCDRVQRKPVVLIVARANELALRRFLLQGVDVAREVRVPDLSEPDIRAILDKLEDRGLLGNLKQLTMQARVEVFLGKAKKQILVAMRESTRGKGFDEIIRAEFNDITPESAQLMYLIAAIPSMHHHPIQRGQLIASMELLPSEISGLVDDNLSGILITYENDPDKLQIRHPLIAEHVIQEVAPRVILAEAYVRFLQALAHDLPPVRDRRASRPFRLYRQVINHRRLHSVFLQQVELCRRIYESVRHHFEGDGHFWLQYGSYELEYGDLDFAENYLLQAEALMPEDPWVATTMAYLFLRKGAEAHSPLAADELSKEGLKRLHDQILTTGQHDPYPYHVLGSQMLAYIRAWIPKDEQAIRLNQLHKEVAEGVNKHPLDGQLKTLANDIKKAELETAIRR